MKNQTSYRITKLLGEGSFGKAYLCVSNKTGQQCVIKQIIMEDMDEEERRDTLNEAYILKKLDHANIIKFVEVFLSKKPKETLNIVTEYADGGDLAQKIKAQKKCLFSENQILDYFTQICLALQHIHKKKIIHRDIKSGNIFLMKNGLVKLGDFGIAKGFKNTWSKAKTLVGTPYYLSPEITSSKPYDAKSDVWALGVLLYEMMSFKMPFDANSLPMLSLKICKGKYPSPPSIYSIELKDILKRCLTVDPEKRPSVNELLSTPYIINRIKGFLKEVNYNQDLSKTIAKKYKEVVKQNRKKPVPSPSSSSVSLTAKSAEIIKKDEEKKEDTKKEDDIKEIKEEGPKKSTITSDKKKIGKFFEKKKIAKETMKSKDSANSINSINSISSSSNKDVSEVAPSKNFKEVLDNYGKNENEVENMHKEEYNQIRLLNSLDNVVNGKEEGGDSDNESISSSISGIYSVASKPEQENETSTIILDDIHIEKKKKEEDEDIPEVPSEELRKKEYGEIEKMRKEIEDKLGLELFKEVYHYVNNNTDKEEIKFDKEKIAAKIREELSKKGYNKDKLKCAIENLDEIFVIIIQERLE